MDLKRIAAPAGLVAGLAIFLATALRQLSLPGFYYDEALDLAPMLDLMRGANPLLLRGLGLGRYPLMLLDYMGSLGGYLTLPFMAVLGPGWLAARAQPLFFACVTIILAWALARRWFGGRAAALTALLLAVNPSFIWFSRQGISVSSTLTVTTLGAVLALGHPATGRRRLAWVFIGGVLLGLGLWTKLLYLRWLVVLGMWAAWALLTAARGARATVWRAWATPRVVLALVLGTALGSAPLLYYNLAGLLRDGVAPSAALMLNSLANPTQQFGVNNLDLLANLRKAWDDVRVFIDGSYFWYNGVPFSNAYAMPALFASLALGFGLSIRNGHWRRWARLPLAILTLTVLGAFTISGLWSTHQFIMLPLPQMMLACAAVWAGDALAVRARPRARAGLAAIVAVALLAAPAYGDAWVNAQHHRTLAATGGSGRFSDAVYALADWLDAQGAREPVALDWGIEKQVRVLTADRVRPVEIFGFTAQPDDAFRASAREALKDPARYYIVLWSGDGQYPGFAVYDRRPEFTRLAQAAGRSVREVFVASERSGLPVYVVLRAD